jgi:hypothetical protein
VLRTADRVEHLQVDRLTSWILEKSHDIVSIGQLVEETGVTLARLRELAEQDILLIEGDRVLNLAVRFV